MFEDMRVISGTAKGHRLQAPRGAETRPTSDKVREAIFDMIGGRVIDENVLDLFAGTGALGIEALSRGAESAVFVERRQIACQIIRANLQHTGLGDRARLLCTTVERAMRSLDGSFAVVFVDPPYATANAQGIMDALSGAKAIENDATVVFEHSPRFAVADRYGRLSLERRKVYGDTAVSIFIAEEEQIR